MHILYLHQYFKIPAQAGGTRSYWISLEFIKRGHIVTMITSKNDQEALVEKELIDNINVIFIRNRYSNNMFIVRRLISFIRFMMISSFVALRQKKVNLVYATSTPLTIGVPALLIKLLRGIPFIFEVRDLWPEFPIQMGAVKSKIIQYFLRSFEKRIYRSARHIIALSPGMKDGIVAVGINNDKVSIIPNMSKIDKFFPHRPDKTIMRRFNISPNKFKVIHFGAMGLANGLEYLIDAAKIMKTKHYINIEFILLGDGMIRNVLQEEIKNLKLNSYFVFIENQPMMITSEIVNCCDCSVITFKNLPVLGTNSPNKLFDSLSAGKPIIVNSSGWTKELIEENAIGLYTDPQNPEELMDAILFLIKNKEIVKIMGENARMLAKTKFDKTILCQKLVRIVEKQVEE